MVDPVEIRREIDQIADAGFGGVEIADVHHSVSEPLDPEGHGWGSAAWNAAVEAALDQGNARGLRVDVTVGPAWPPAIPTITPDSPAAAKELVHGLVPVAGGETYSGPVPQPGLGPHAGVNQQVVLAVQAARVSPGSSPTARPVVLDAGSVVQLDVGAEGEVSWTAPHDGQWVLIALWVRGSGQRPERGPHTEPLSYVVDHFDSRGVEAITDFWESNLLTPEVRRLLPQSGGSIFEDSIEMETQGTVWTARIPEEFERRRGYSLWVHMPAIIDQSGNAVFRLGDATLTGQVRYDFEEVLTELYVEHHLVPLQHWAHTIGMKLRIQPAGLRTDSIYKAAIVDNVEGETLGFQNLDDFRCLAGGRDMGGRKLLSSEAGAYQGAAYNTTWKRILQSLCGEFAAGVNLAVLHGFSYADAPGARWPGFAAFSPYDGGPGFSEAWGPRHPTWGHASAIADYLGRNQLVLQSGTPKIDVAILRQRGFSGTGVGTPWFTAGMGASPTSIGWTHQIITHRLLDLPAATVEHGRLAPDGPAYKVLVLEGDVFAGRAPSLEVRTAERLLELAAAGLAIVIIGAWDAARVPGLERAGENARLQDLIAELLTKPTVRHVADRPIVPDALVELGLEPDVSHGRSSLILAHRVVTGADFYYFSNGFHAVRSVVQPIDQVVSLRRSNPDAVPYRLDAWTGDVERVAIFEEEGPDRVRVRVALKPGETTIIALGRRDWHNDQAGHGLHATSSDAHEVRFTDRGLSIRTLQAGQYATTLSNGQTVTSTFDAVPAVQDLRSWHLSVDDWQPGATATETVIERHELELDALVPWSEIPQLADVSGVGRYTTTVNLGNGWERHHGAYLDLGEFVDTARIVVNGQPLPPVDLMNPAVDIGSALRPGSNVIELEVASTLLNRLRVVSPDVFSGTSRQRYGLMGPVRLVPYADAVVQRPN
jgi:hypothetical protein